MQPWASIKASATFKTKARTRLRLAIAASIMVWWRTASEGGPYKASPREKPHRKRMSYRIKAGAFYFGAVTAFLIMLAALFASDSFSKPITLEYFLLMTTAMRKAMLIPASEMAFAIL